MILLIANRDGTIIKDLCREMGYEHFKKLGEPGGMSGPCGAGDEIAVDNRAEEVDRDEGSASKLDFGGAGGIGIQPAALEYAGRGKQLGTVAEGGDGFAGLVEVADDVEDFGIEAEILRSASAGDDQGIVSGWIYLIKRRVEAEVVATFLGVGLVAFKVVDGGADLVAFFLAGTDGVDRVADHLQSLERHHDFVVFNKIASEQQQLCGFHR